MSYDAQAKTPHSPGLITVSIDTAWPYYIPWTQYVPVRDRQFSATFVDLDSGIQEQAEATYNATAVLGRGESYQTYINTANRTVSLNFQLRAQGLDGASAPEASILAEVIRWVQFLESLKYPFITVDGLSHAPPPCYLQIGSLLNMRCVVNATVTWVGPWDTDTHLPYGADVACTFISVATGMGNYQQSAANRMAPFSIAINQLGQSVGPQ